MPTPKLVASLASNRSRSPAPNDKKVFGSSADKGIYLKLSSGSRGTRGSASTDQSSCQRLNKMAGRVGAWSSAWTDWSAPATPPPDKIRAAMQAWVLNRVSTGITRQKVRLLYDSQHRFICRSTNEFRRRSLRETGPSPIHDHRFYRAPLIRLHRRSWPWLAFH